MAIKYILNPFTGKFDATSVEDLSGYVPYTGANATVDLGAQNLTTTGILEAGNLDITSSDVLTAIGIEYPFNNLVVSNYAALDASHRPVGFKLAYTQTSTHGSSAAVGIGAEMIGQPDTNYVGTQYTGLAGKVRWDTDSRYYGTSRGVDGSLTLSTGIGGTTAAVCAGVKASLGVGSAASISLVGGTAGKISALRTDVNFGTNANISGDGVGEFGGIIMDADLNDATVTHFAHLYANTVSLSGGSIDNLYGIYVGDQTAGTANYGVVVASDTIGTTYGVGLDAKIWFDGDSLNINPRVVTATDALYIQSDKIGFNVDPATNAQNFFEFEHWNYADISVALRPTMLKGSYTQTTVNSSSIATGMGFNLTAKHTATQGQLVGVVGQVTYDSNSGCGQSAALRGYWLVNPGHTPRYASPISAMNGFLTFDNASTPALTGSGKLFAGYYKTLWTGTANFGTGETNTNLGVLLCQADIEDAALAAFSGLVIDTFDIDGGSCTTVASMWLADQTVGGTNYGLVIDSDTIGVTLGAGQDYTIYGSATDLIINSNNITANDEIHFTNFDAYLFDNKIILTQTDGNEYIDSLADGYVDIGATTGIRLTSPLTRVTGDLYVGNDADVDPAIVFDGDTNDGQVTYKEDEDYFLLSSPLQVPYLGAAPATLTNGMIWMESDGLHIYYNDAEKVVAGA